MKNRLTSDADIRELLESTRVIAVVGLSPDRNRPSHRVARYLQEVGYRVVPVNPCGGTILGEDVFSSLADALHQVPQVDLVNVFRRPDVLPDLVEEVIALGGKRVWLQVGVTHAGAEERALTANIDLIVNRCMLVEHGRLCDSAGDQIP